LTGASYAQDDLAVKGRDILEKNRKSIVTIQMVIKQQVSMSGMGSSEDETRSESTGLIIDPSGLAVISLSTADPSSMYERMSEMSDEMADFKIKCDITDAKYLMEDGTEVPARVVLRDKDLDLAYFRPVTAPATPMQAADLAQAGDPLVLDQVISLNRLGKVANRTYSASVERIQAVVAKPRKYYIPGNDPTQTSLGSPAFTTDGKLVGCFMLRAIKGADDGGMNPLSMLSGGLTSVIVPCADIAEGAKQAPSVDEAAKKEAEEKAAEEAVQPKEEEKPAASDEPPADAAEKPAGNSIELKL
jgi:S1-C subfamily serine protease